MFQPVAGTPFDFRTPHAVADRVRDASSPQIVFGKGYDHNWVVGRAVTPDQHLMARVSDRCRAAGSSCGRTSRVLQFYSGNFLTGTIPGKSGRLYRPGETPWCSSRKIILPDTPNRPDFGSARLAPGLRPIATS